MKTWVKDRTGNIELRSAGLGLLVSAVLSIALAALIATLLINGTVNEAAIGICALGSLLISSFAGCLTAGKLGKSKIAIVAGVSAVLYFVVLVGVGVLLFDELLSNIWTSMASIAAGYGAACAICISGNGSRKKRRRGSW